MCEYQKPKSLVITYHWGWNHGERNTAHLTSDQFALRLRMQFKRHEFNGGRRVAVDHPGEPATSWTRCGSCAPAPPRRGPPQTYCREQATNGGTMTIDHER